MNDDRVSITYKDVAIADTLEAAEEKASEWVRELTGRGYDRIFIEIERMGALVSSEWLVFLMAQRTI